jgi:hypothetical protein
LQLCMDYEPHDMVLHATSLRSKQTSDFTIVHFVKSLSRKSSSLLVKQEKRDGERTERRASSCDWPGSMHRFSAS